MSITDTNIATGAGRPLPLGPSISDNGVNFALFCRHGSSVSLVFRYLDSTELQEVALDPAINKTGDIWHIFLPTGGAPVCYGYRIRSEATGLDWIAESAEHTVVDPYCRRLQERVWGVPSQAGKEPVCIAAEDDGFDWQGDRPLKIPDAETIIYELHVRGFSRHPSSNVSEPGTFRGLVEKIPYLQELGITAVELLPVTEWDETDSKYFNPQTGEKLLNYWGYNPLSFFALRSGLAADPADVAGELKLLVRSLHQAGIEVILDLVFNHTGESDEDGTTSSFRAIDNSIYYLIDEEKKRYHNFTGCGNTVNCNHPVVRKMIIDALRYYVTEFHIDGFRFDLAAIFSRDLDGKPSERAPLIELIAEDPVLRDCKIIAEAWDASGLYQVGSFSTSRRWLEWNGRFRDDIRTFMLGRSESVHKLATRIAGSSDLYQDDGRSPLNSVNFITSHDGFTLYDLVSYNHKRNQANGEKDRDGENHNLSWNSGFEGAPAALAVERMRQRRIRTFTALLLISQGIPMISAGDEIGRSQNGNNNAWCQDNETSWINWHVSDSGRELLRFFRKCIDLRKRNALFRRSEFFKIYDPSTPQDLRDISWQSLIPGVEDWSAECLQLGILLNGHYNGNGPNPSFYIMVNGSITAAKSFTLPTPPGRQAGARWALIVDTAARSPNDFVDLEDAKRVGPGAALQVEPMALVILQSTAESA